MRVATVWAAAGLLGALGLGVQAAGLDVALFQAVNRPLGGRWPTLWTTFSVLGLGLSALIVVAALARGRSAPGMRLLAALLWSLPIGGGATHLLKWACAVPRPPAVLSADQLLVIGEPMRHGSMPSGHALTVGVLLALALLRPGSRWPVGLAAALALLVGLARLATAAHWPSDVLVGAAAGLCTGVLAWQLAGHGRLAAWLGERPGQIALGLGQIACGAAMWWLPTGYPDTGVLTAVLGGLGLGAGLQRLLDGRGMALALRRWPA